jgi:transcriptional regulator with XRE-family HTH domain
MDKKRVLRELKKRQGTSTQNSFASTVGISPVYLSDIYAGKRDIGPKVLAYLGIERQTVYRWR